MNRHEQLDPARSEYPASFDSLPGLRPYKIGHSTFTGQPYYLFSDDEISSLNGGNMYGGTPESSFNNLRVSLKAIGVYLRKRKLGRLTEGDPDNPRIAQRVKEVGLVNED